LTSRIRQRNDFRLTSNKTNSNDEAAYFKLPIADGGDIMASHITRIEPKEAWASGSSGFAELICAYEDEEKCRQMRVKGAFTRGEFLSRKKELSFARELIFYCA